jgi:hypothetical protein
LAQGRDPLIHLRRSRLLAQGKTGGISQHQPDERHARGGAHGLCHSDTLQQFKTYTAGRAAFKDATFQMPLRIE